MDSWVISICRWMGAAALFLIMSFTACSADEEERPRRVRPAALAGSWYPAGKEELAREVDRYLAEAEEASLPGRLFGLIAPHAGYRYSGKVAGWAFRQVKPDSIDRVVILAPSHLTDSHGFSIMDVDAYATPLGEIPLDKDVCGQLAAHELHMKDDRLHVREHAIEIELPFLQQVFREKEFRLVPILVGALVPGDAEKIAAALKPHLSRRTLIVVSSDFTHYGRRFGYLPFTENIEENLRKLDMGAVDLILRNDSEGFAKYVAETGATICGRNAIAIFLRTLPEDAQGKLLKYDTSGRMTGSFATSVSYVSAAFAAPDGKEDETMHEGGNALTLEEKKRLLRIARETMEAAVLTGSAPTDLEGRYVLTPRLRAKAGAFVTIEKHGRLRGCIGRIGYPEIADELPSLYRSVMLMAVAAAKSDPRFPPVRPDELKEIEIDISVLSIAKEVKGPEDFIVGKHGIIIRQGRRSAVFLPQVAPEQGWTREETLQHLCRKAGLPSDAWQAPTMKFFVFTAQVFDESLLTPDEPG